MALTPPVRSLTTPDSAKSTVAVADLDELVSAADRPLVDVQVGMVSYASGAAILLWGPEALCLAYNRQSRSLAGLRAGVLGKPLFRVQPELERAFRPRVDLAMLGSGTPVD